MALNNVTIAFDLAQLLGSDFNIRRTRAYVVTNVVNQTLMDTSTGETRMGDEKVTLADDGTGTFTTWGVGPDGNPASWQTSLVVEYDQIGRNRRKQVRTFGPWTLTDADNGKNITALEDEQAIPAEYRTAFTDEMQSYAAAAYAAQLEAETARDLAKDISGVAVPDDVVAVLVLDEDSDTAAALSTMIPIGSAGNDWNNANRTGRWIDSTDALNRPIAVGGWWVGEVYARPNGADWDFIRQELRLVNATDTSGSLGLGYRRYYFPGAGWQSWERLIDTETDLTASFDESKRRPTQAIVGAQAIVDSLASAALTGHTVGTPVTGLSEPDTAAAVTAFNTLSGGSYTSGDLLRTQPNYASPRKDPIFRINGAFKYNADSSAQTAGTWIAGRTDAIPQGGATGNQGQVSFTLPAGSRYFLMRYRAVGSGSTVMKARFWASKDGGTPKPFRTLASQDGNENITLSADGLYALLPVDLGAAGEWTITIDFATATFGGIWTLASLAPIAPRIRAGRALFIADSFGTPGQGQFSTSLGYIMRVVRELGLEAHVSAQGGTGVVARNGAAGVGVNYNYLERVTQVGGDVDGFFDDLDQPAYIGLQLSQNDDTYGWAGTPEFAANFEALCRHLRGRFPHVPFDVYGIMHTRERSDASGSPGFATKQEGFYALEDAAIAFLEANPDLNIGYVPGLLRAGIATGTGYLGNPNGTGTSDTATWTDSSHASPINGTEPTGHGQIATQILAVTRALRPQTLQPNGGYKPPLKLTATIGTGRSEQAASGDHVHTDAVSTATARAASGPYRVIHDFGTLNLTGLSTGTDYIFAPGVGVVTAGTAGSAAGMFNIDDDQQAISGLTTKMRMRVQTFCNATAPACTFTVELVLAGALSGAGDPSVGIGAALSPAYTATITTPAANSKTAASSGQVNAPATNTFYLVKVTTSANMAASSNVRMRVVLEANNA